MASDSNSWVEVTAADLEVGAAHDFLAHPNAGGTCVFVGRTRQWTGDQETLALRYEAYAPMAEVEMTALTDTVAERWGSLRTVLLHRVGDLEVGEASVVVGVSCAHRAAAFEATRWLIDSLKKSVPIWKTDL